MWLLKAQTDHANKNRTQREQKFYIICKLMRKTPSSHEELINYHFMHYCNQFAVESNYFVNISNENDFNIYRQCNENEFI